VWERRAIVNDDHELEVIAELLWNLFLIIVSVVLLAGVIVLLLIA